MKIAGHTMGTPESSIFEAIERIGIKAGAETLRRISRELN